MRKRSFVKRMLLAGLFCVSAVRAECDVTVSENTVDYGKLSHSDISHHRGEMYALDEREVRVNAICSEPRTMAIFISDDSGLKRFQFGDNGDILVSAQQGVLDGKPVDLGKTLTQGSFTPAGRHKRKMVILNNDGLLPVRNGEVAVGQQFSFLLHLRPALKSGGHSAHDEEDLLANLFIRLENQ